MKPDRQEIERVYREQGYRAAKALADEMGIIWFASAVWEGTGTRR